MRVMSTRSFVLSLLFGGASFLTSCQSRIRMVEAEELPILGTAPLQHTVYIGSDERFHFFNAQDGKILKKFKIRRGLVSFENEQEVGETSRIVTRDAKGALQLLFLKR